MARNAAGPKSVDPMPDACPWDHANSLIPEKIESGRGGGLRLHKSERGKQVPDSIFVPRFASLHPRLYVRVCSLCVSFDMWSGPLISPLRLVQFEC